MSEKKVRILFAQFPFGNSTCPDAADWVTETVLKCKRDKRIGDVLARRYDDTPITMTRNRCLHDAQRLGVDLVVMIDSDMKPDLRVAGAKPFWDTSFNFWYKRRKQGPLVVAAPYCGPPPCENIYVFRWGNRQSDHPNVDVSLDQFCRDEAAFRAGMEEVGALPTGLILIDVRALEKLKPPYFQYEWTDATQSEKASTEDVFFTRNLSLAGVPQFVNWDAWAGHWKRKCVGKPTTLTVEDVREEFREALACGMKRNERVVIMPPLSDEQRKELFDAIEKSSDGKLIVIPNGAGHDGPTANRTAGLDQQPHPGVGGADGRRTAGEEALLA